MTTGTATSALGKIRERRGVLETQISAATREIQALDTKIHELDLRKKDGDKRAPAQLEKVREPYQAKAHARAALVKEDGRLRIEEITLGKESTRLKEQIDALDMVMQAYFKEGAPDIDLLSGLLRAADAAYMAMPGYIGVPQNSVRGVLSFLNRSDDLLRRREKLDQRIAELGDAN